LTSVRHFTAIGLLTVLTVTGSAAQPIFFGYAPLPEAAGFQAAGLLDWNRDGTLDVIAFNESTRKIAIFPGNGSGDFTAPVVVDLTFTPYSITVGDFGNGARLAIQSGTLGPRIILADITAQGELLAIEEIVSTRNIWGVVAEDLYGNGVDEILIVERIGTQENVIAVYRLVDGAMQRSFQMPGANGNLTSITAADINGDGSLDLVIGHANVRQLTVHLSDGEFGFGPFTQYATHNVPNHLAIADFTGNGILDVIASENAGSGGGNNTLTLYAGDGEGRFTQERILYTGNPGRIKTGDFNGNGLSDLLYGSESAVRIMTNIGGFFLPGRPMPLPSGAGGILTGDLNGDGRLDFINTAAAPWRFLNGGGTEGYYWNVWTGGGDGTSWGDAANWQDGNVPWGGNILVEGDGVVVRNESQLVFNSDERLVVGPGATLVLDSGSNIRVSGAVTFEIREGGTLEFGNVPSIDHGFVGNTDPATIFNLGTLRKNSPQATGGVHAVENWGTLEAAQGIFRISRVMHGPEGKYRTLPGGELHFNWQHSLIGLDNEKAFGTGSAFEGGGIFRFSRGPIRIEGTYDVAGTTIIDRPAQTDPVHVVIAAVANLVQIGGDSLDVGGLGSLTIEPSVSLTVGGTSVIGTLRSPAPIRFTRGLSLRGTIDVPGDILISGPLEWSGGTFSGTGEIRLNGGGRFFGTTTNNTRVVGNRRLIIGTGSLVTQIGGAQTQFGTGSSLEIEEGGEFELNGGSLVGLAGAAPFIENRGTFLKTGTGTAALAFPFENHGSIEVREGTLRHNAALQALPGSRISGSGTIQFASPTTLQNAGLLSPGASPGRLNVSGSIINERNGIAGAVRIEIGGPDPVTDHDVLNVTSSLRLHGTLEVALLDGYVPPVGQRFPVITAGTLLGTFDEYRGLQIAPTRKLEVVYGARQVELVVVESEPVDGVVEWTNGGGDDSWHNPANWSPARVPGPEDEARIGLASARVRTETPAVVGALEFSAEDGRLVLGDSLTIGGLYRQLGQSQLDGSGDLVVDGEFEWISGDMTGTGRTIIRSEGIIGTSQGETTRRLAGRLVEIRESAVLRFTDDRDILLSAGRIAIRNGGRFEMIGNGNILTDDAGGAIEVSSGGILVHSGDSVRRVEALVDNSGVVRAESGALQLTALDEEVSGDFVVAEGARIDFALGSNTLLLEAASFSGDGDIAVRSGALEFRGDIDLAGSLTVGGTAGESAALNLPGTARVTRLGLMALKQNGALTLGGEPEIILSSLDVEDGSSLIASRPLRVTERLRILGGALASSSDVTVTGAFEWGAGMMSGDGITRLAAGGAIVKLPGAATGPHLSVRRLLIPNNTVLTIGEDGVLAGSDGAVIEVATGGALSLGSGASLVEATGSILRPRIENRGLLAATGTAAASVAFDLRNRGSVNLGGERMNITGRLFNESEGTIRGPGILDISTADLVEQRGIIAPGGDAGGNLAIVGDLDNSLGTIRLRLRSATDVDQLNVSGTLIPGLRLILEAMPGFTAAGGELLDLIAASAVTGRFSDVLIPDLGADIRARLAYEEDAIRLALVRFVRTQGLASTPWPTVGQNAGRTGGSSLAVPGDPAVRAMLTALNDDRFNTEPVIGLEGTLLLGTEGGSVYAFDTEGTALWNALLGHPVSGLVVAADGIAYVSTRSGLYAVDRNGSTLWTTLGSVDLPYAPSIRRDGTLIVQAADGQVLAVGADGSVVWETAPHGTPATAAAFREDTGFVASVSGAVTALGSDGETLWFINTGSALHSLLLTGQAVIVASETGILRALDPATGAEAWRHEGAGAHAAPVLLSDGSIAVSTASGIRHIAPDGSLIRDLALGLEGRPVTGLTSSASNVVIVAAGDQLIATANDAVVWTLSLPQTLSGRSVVGSGRSMYAVNGGLLALIGEADAAPRLEIQVTRLDFGSVVTGEDSTRQLTIRNTGTATLRIEEVLLADDQSPFAVVDAPATIAPESSAEIGVRFSPATVGGFENALTIRSNGGEAIVSLVGEGEAPPNRPPVVTRALADLTLLAGGDAFVVVLDTIFVDPDGDAMTFGATTSGESVVGIDLIRALLSVSPLAPGSDVITAWADDGRGGRAETSFTVTVQALPVDPPIAVADTFTVLQGQVLAIAAPGVLANDIDPLGGPLTAVLVETARHGLLSLAEDGGFEYRPEVVFAGEDYFVYAAVRGEDTSEPVRVILRVESSAITFSITDLGSLGGSGSRATAISDNGHVVGLSRRQDGSIGGFSWSSGVITALRADQAEETQALAVNAGGHVAGLIRTGAAGPRAVRWVDSEIQPMVFDGSTSAVAYAINAAGKVVGSYTTASGGLRAFIWQNGAFTDAGTFGGDYAELFAINEAGVHAGIVVENGVPRGIVGAQIVPDDNSRLYGLSNTGAAVGSIASQTRVLASMWLENGTRVPLARPEDLFSEAYGVNDAGWIVGSYAHHPAAAKSGEHDAMMMHSSVPSAYRPLHGSAAKNDVAASLTSYNLRAFLWKDGERLDLNDLIAPDSGWTLEEARGINSLGQIVGTGRRDNVLRAFLLEPTGNRPPAPAALFAETRAGESIEIDVLSNIVDPDGDALRLVSISRPSSGEAQVTPTGTVVFTPGPGQARDEILEYVVADDRGASARGVLAIRVLETNPGDNRVLTSYPNPFSQSTTIRLTITEAGPVRLTVYSLLGKETIRLLEGHAEPGILEVPFDANGLPSGVYFCRLETGSISETTRLILSR
jgi:probable HAF family extracellular repeat protein